MVDEKGLLLKGIRLVVASGGGWLAGWLCSSPSVGVTVGVIAGVGLLLALPGRLDGGDRRRRRSVG